MELKMVTVKELIGLIDDAIDTACKKTYKGDKAYEGSFAESTADLIAVTTIAADVKNWLLSNPPSGYGLVGLNYMLYELKMRLKAVNINFNYKEVFSLERSY
jgi:hypothetical protein